MDVIPVTLAGKRVRLEPLRVEHVADLWAVGADERLWRYTSFRITNLDDMRAWVETALAWQAAGTIEEGTFRNHMIHPDGSTRHSVWFSVIAEAWLAVKARLLQRL